MADLWYYGRGAEIFGPFSGWDVAELADAGEVLATDTVWEDGAEDGVPAGTVPHLFSAPVTVPAAVAPIERQAARRGRATAGAGVTIVGQDGTTVRYRMKCVACGQEDRNSNTRAIGRGAIRVGFYCPKCRKRRTAEIYCQLV